MACDNNQTELQRAAEEPRSVTGDQGSVTNHTLREQIEYDKYKDNKAAASKGFRVIYGQRIIPPSARGY